MNPFPPDSSAPFPSFVRPGGIVRPAPEQAGEKIAARWAALHEAAAVIAALAGQAPLSSVADAPGFAEALGQMGGWRLRLAREGIEDLSAILQTGIAALLALHGRGGGAVVAPASALWEEFLRARAGLIALCPPEIADQRRLA